MKFLIDPSDHRFFFDEVAADRAVKFIRKYLRIHQDKYNGPMELLPYQEQLVRNIFGWKWKKDLTRRFNDVLLYIAKGNGKTPLMAAIGLYAFLADIDPRTNDIRRGVNVVSVASNFEQASISFNAAADFVKNSNKLSEMVEIQARKLLNLNENGGKWTVFSSSPRGKAGFQYNIAIADELHEFDPKGRDALLHIKANLIKRSDTLCLMATNCGKLRNSFCYEEYEKAKKIEEDPEINLAYL